MLNNPLSKRSIKLSIKSRLLWAATLWLSLMILAAGYVIPSLVSQYLVQNAQQQMTLAMDQITANLGANSKGQLSLPIRLSDPRYSQPYSGLYWTAEMGDQLLRSRSLWDQVLKQNKHGLKKGWLGAKGEPLITLTRTIYLPEFSHSIEIVVGMDRAPVEETVSKVINQLWLILGLLFVGILMLVSVQVSWSLLPLRRMQKELSSLRNGQRSELSDSYPLEVSPLVNDLNALLFHYQELLDRARNHAGNLSHALKTPLSVLKNEIDKLDEETYQKLSAPVSQIQGQIDYHLGRARMAGASNILAVKSCPSERVDAISMAFDKIYASRDVTLVNELDSDLLVAVEGSDLDEMLGNLLENSYKWSNSLIRIYSRPIDKEWVELCIEDDGPGIAAEKLESAIERGVRLDETMPGTGLGLNIVAEMAHSYRGELHLEKAKLGGLKATLKLKTAS